MFLRTMALCAATCTTPLPLAAEITSRALWTLWQEGGTQISAEAVDRDDAGIRLEGVTLEIGGTRFTVEAMRLSDLDDGHVAIEIDGPVRARHTGLPQQAATRIDLSQARITVDRLDERLEYAIGAPRLRAGFADAGPALPRIDLSINDLDATIQTRAEGGDPISARTVAQSVLAEMRFQGEPETVVDLRLDGFEDETRFDPDAPDEFDLSSTFSRLVLDLEGTVAAEPFEMTMRSGAGSLVSSASGATRSAALETEALRVAATGDAVPRSQGSATIGALRYAVTVPVEAGAGPQPVALDLVATDIAPTEAYWAQIDPDRALPRDDWNLVLRMTGTARLPEKGDEPLPPDAVSEVTLNDLSATAFGAELKGSGRVERPLSQVDADGTLTFTATDLLEAIGAMSVAGLIAPGQELGARMALAFATVQDPDGDGLRTELRFGPDGSITLNDLPVR